MKALAVTGVGVVSPLGIGFERFASEFATHARAGTDAFAAESTVLTAMTPDARIAEAWGFDATKHLGSKGLRNHDRLTLMALVAASCLSSGDMMKSLAMVALGLLIGIVGTDVNSGMARFSFGIAELTDGLQFTVIAVGLFAVSEIVRNLETEEQGEVFTSKITHLMPTWADLKSASNSTEIKRLSGLVVQLKQ